MSVRVAVRVLAGLLCAAAWCAHATDVPQSAGKGHGPPDFHKPPRGKPGHASGITCSVSSVSLAFGTYSPLLRSHNDTVGTIAVACSGRPGALAAYSIALSAGRDGTLSPRRMRSGSGAALSYNIYTGADRRIVWGDGNAGSVLVSDSFTLRAGRVTRMYPVYGRAFRTQNVPVGAYSDLIVVTLEF